MFCLFSFCLVLFCFFTQLFDHLLTYSIPIDILAGITTPTSARASLLLALILVPTALPLEKTTYLYILDKSSHPGNEISDS